MSTDRPISFEVCADGFDEMRRQAHRLSSWGENVYVKIPVTNTAGISSRSLIADLTADGLHLNVTGILSLPQVREVAESFRKAPALWCPYSPVVSRTPVVTRSR